MNGKFSKLKDIHSRFTWLELLLLTGWIFLMCIYISPGSFRHTVGFMLRNPLLILLNVLPIAVLLLVIYFACMNSFASGAAANLVFGLLSYANLLKIDGRDDPLVPADVLLLREALQASGDYRLDLHPAVIAVIVLSTAVFIALAIVLGKKRKQGGCAMSRIIGIVLSIAVFTGAFFGLYRDRELYASFPVSSVYNVTTIFNELGLNYCFLYNFNLYTVDKPDDYSAKTVESYISEQKTEEPEGVKPQIIMIMCEAFNDVTDADAFTYSEEDDPMHGFYEVASSPNSINGHIVVPNFGAGTANTEFDVLTGMQTNLISATSNSAMRSFHHSVPSMATLLGDQGYSSLYFHPGSSWFYNRDSALSFLGVDERVFVEDLEDKSNMETSFLKNLKQLVSERTQNGERLFTYATTIQNHQAYTYSKYDFEVPKVQTSVQLSDYAEELLSVYAYGVKCSSDMLLELTEYLNSLDDPYVLVFFGDHRPNLGADYLAYNEIGMDIADDVVANCSAPFVIWANDAYAKTSDFADRFASLDIPEDGYISANFLGEVTLELAGCAKSEPFFSFLYDLRREIPVIKTGVNSDAEQPMIDKLHCWQYYRMS